MRVLGGSLCVIAMAACTSHQPPPNDQPRESGYRPPEVILRNTSWEDPELAAKGLGRMEVVVRVADRPAQTIHQALVDVRLVADGNLSKKVLTDQNGVARFDSIAVGRYQLTVRAIGYANARSEVTVSGGCRTDVEAYIGISAQGIAPPPPEPGRIRVTTCRTPQ
jgi:hypothetical protein